MIILAVIAWIGGFPTGGYGAGNLFHLILILVVILVLVRFLGGGAHLVL